MAENDLENRLAGLHGVLQKLEALGERRESVFRQYYNLYTPYKKKWRAGAYWLWVLLLTMVLSFLVLFNAVSKMAETTDGSELGYLALFLVPLPLALVLSAILVAIRNSRVPAKNARIEVSNQAAAQRIAELTAPDVAPIDEQLAAVRKECRENYGGWFPQKYLNSVDVGACWQIVRDGRTSTVQEAVNALIEDQRHQAILDMHAAQIAEQQRASRVTQVNGVMNATLQGANLGNNMAMRNDLNRWVGPR